MANDPAYDYYGNSPGIWGRLRARWAGMSSAYRYNTVLYGLAVVALSALVLEVAFGESSPKFEVATQVVPLTTTSSRPRPTSTSSTTIDPLAVTSTIPAAGAPAGGGSPVGPLTPTTRRSAGAAAAPNPASSGGGSNTTQANQQEPEITNPTFPPIPPPSNSGTTSPPNTNTTSPPATAPPPPPDPTITIPTEWCDMVPGRFNCP